MLNYYLLRSCLYDNHFKQLSRCLSNAALLLLVRGIKYLLFYYLKDCTAYGNVVLDIEYEIHSYLHSKHFLFWLIFNNLVWFLCEMCTETHFDSVLYHYMILTGIEICWHISVKFSSIKFHEILFNISQLVTTSR
jgi:hypothetical protein